MCVCVCVCVCEQPSSWLYICDSKKTAVSRTEELLYAFPTPKNRPILHHATPLGLCVRRTAQKADSSLVDDGYFPAELTGAFTYSTKCRYAHGMTQTGPMSRFATQPMSHSHAACLFVRSPQLTLRSDTMRLDVLSTVFDLRC